MEEAIKIKSLVASSRFDKYFIFQSCCMHASVIFFSKGKEEDHEPSRKRKLDEATFILLMISVVEGCPLIQELEIIYMATNYGNEIQIIATEKLSAIAQYATVLND